MTADLSGAEQEALYQAACVWNDDPRPHNRAGMTVLNDAVAQIRDAAAEVARAEGVAEDCAECAREEAWPCDNYSAPVCCLSAPSSEQSRCLFCFSMAAIAVSELRARVEAEIAEIEGVGRAVGNDVVGRRWVVRKFRAALEATP